VTAADRRAAPPSGTPPRPPDHRWELVLPHRCRLLGIARRRLPSLQDAEDCVQEALIRAAGAATLREEQVGRLLTTIVIRLCVDHFRARAAACRALPRLHHTGNTVPSPEEAVCDRAEAAWLRDRIAERLSVRERAVLQARAEGLSIRQAAARLHITASTAEAAFTRARVRLRRLAD
jgi:RNA polymerase sigma factor (sigma-70 family)